MPRRRYYPTPQENMEKKWGKATEYIARIRLPEHEQYLNDHPEAAVWLKSQKKKVLSWQEEGNETKFDSSLSGYVRGNERVNELIAKDYAEGKDPEDWDLRYVRWMVNLQYILFDSEKWGEFKMYRVYPKEPDIEQWFTVDEMIDMLENPLFTKALEVFEMFPSRPEKLTGPGVNEDHLHIEVTPEGVTWRTEFGERAHIRDGADEVVAESVSGQLCLETGGPVQPGDS